MPDLSNWIAVVNHPLGFAAFGLALLAWVLAKFGPNKYPWLPHLFIGLAGVAFLVGVIQSFNETPEEKEKQGKEKSSQAETSIRQESNSAQSPNVTHAGNVTINYGEIGKPPQEGVSAKAYEYAIEMLYKKDLELTNKNKVIKEWEEKYLELKKDLSEKEKSDEVSPQLISFMDAGEFAKAGKLIDKQLTMDKKNERRAADHHFIRARIFELQFDYKNALEHYETAARLAPENSLYQNNAGFMANTLGQYDKAIVFYEKALTSDLKTFGPEHPNVAIVWNNLGEAWMAKGEYDKAIGYFERALASNLKTFGPDHPRVARSWNNLGGTWHSKGKFDKAIEFYEKALASNLKTFGPGHPNVARHRNNLGEAWRAKGKYNKAIEYYEKALASDLKTFGPEHPQVAIYWNNLGLAWDAKDQNDKAIEFYEKALASDLKTFGSDHPSVARIWNNLGLAWDAKGQNDKAIGYYEKAREIWEKSGLDHMVATVEDNLAEARRKKDE